MLHISKRRKYIESMVSIELIMHISGEFNPTLFINAFMNPT